MTIEENLYRILSASQAVMDDKDLPFDTRKKAVCVNGTVRELLACMCPVQWQAVIEMADKV